MPQTTHRIVGVLELTALTDTDVVQFSDLQWSASVLPEDQLHVAPGANLLADVVRLANELRAEYQQHTRKRPYALV